MGKTATEVRSEIEQARSELGGTLDAIGEKVSPKRIAQRRMDSTRAGVINLREKVMGTAENVQHSASDTMGHASQSAHHLASSAADAGRAGPQAVSRQTQGNPIAAGLVAFGAGLVIASFLPETRVEAQRAAELDRRFIEPAKDELKSAGQAAVADLREAATDSAIAVKAKASEAAEEITAEAKHAATDLTAEAKDAAAEVKAKAKP